MRRKTEQQKKSARLLVGFSYGGLIGLIIGLTTGNLILAMAFSLTGAVSLALEFAMLRSWAGACVRFGSWGMTLAWTVASIWTMALAWAVAAVAESWDVFVVVYFIWSSALVWDVAVALETIAKNKNTSREALITDHAEWFMLLLQKFRLFIKNRNHTKAFTSSAKASKLSHVRKCSWDVQLVVSFAHELAAVFPEEWDEWQHWISDMMDSRTRMQSKGMNHRLVSLITFCRLFRFALHIGIDKVFILATRRATM